MRRKRFLLVVGFAALALVVVSMNRTGIVSAEESNEVGVGGAGGAGGAGGGGGGGGGGFGEAGGALSAFGDFVYVLEQGNLYQYAAYDLTLVKRTDLSGQGAPNRVGGRQGVGRRGDGAAGEDGDGDRGGAGGAGGQGGFGGGGAGRSEDVAAHGEYVYVLQGKTLRKLYANGLKQVKVVTLDFDAKPAK
jgi:hypothetical protein